MKSGVILVMPNSPCDLKFSLVTKKSPETDIEKKNQKIERNGFSVLLSMSDNI